MTSTAVSTPTDTIQERTQKKIHEKSLNTIRKHGGDIFKQTSKTANRRNKDINRDSCSKPFSREVQLVEKQRKVSTFPNANGPITEINFFIKRAGKYLLGPKVGKSPVRCIQQYLARKEGSDNYYVLKILTRREIGQMETPDDIQGKTLLHTEHSLLSLLKNEQGVVHEHGMFKESVKEPFINDDGFKSFKEVRRFCLVLDCFVSHDFSPKFNNITDLQCHIIRQKKISEAQAIRLFWKVLQIVDRLHKQNIVHRDLKLGNIIWDKSSGDIKLSNFCLGKHLSSETDLLKDQRGSPGYVSPCVISGKPYSGKPSDMWSLGVVLYTLLFGQFPFYDESPTGLFRKIKTGVFEIPADVNVSSETIEVIKSLLVLDPKKRLTSSETLLKVENIIVEQEHLMRDSDLQVVPVAHTNVHPGCSPIQIKKRNISMFSSTLERYEFAADMAILLEKSNENIEKTKKLNNGNKTANLNDLVDHLTQDKEQLMRNQSIYVARKISHANTLGKLSAKMISEELDKLLGNKHTHAIQQRRQFHQH